MINLVIRTRSLVKKSIQFIKDLSYEINWYLTLHELRATNNRKRIILIGTPEHGNLGDHAIAIATNKLLNEHVQGYRIIEITYKQYRSQKNRIVNLINKNDIIIISGGGFMGTLYPAAEIMVRDFITSFSENRIIIFPQTIYYKNNSEGQLQLSISKSIY